LRIRLASGIRRISLFVIPSCIAFLILGDVVVGVLYQGGRFHRSDTIYVWSILAGSSLGLLATSWSQLYSSTFYALLDTRTPLRISVIRVATAISMGIVLALLGPKWVGIHARWGAAGLTVAASIAGWVEFILLRLALTKRIGAIEIPVSFNVRLWLAAAVAAVFAFGLKLLVGATRPIVTASLVLGLYGGVYLASACLLGIEESRTLLDRWTRRCPRAANAPEPR
jgi:putative peptidoglycan lipid II flippase